MQAYRDGYIHKPIFDIDFDKVIPDTLHANIRVVNRIMKLLHRKLKLLDKKKSVVIEQLPHTNQLDIFFRSVGINNAFYIQTTYDEDNSTQELKMRTFTGKECLKICKNCDFDRRFSSIKRHSDLSTLLTDFYRIHMGVTHNFYISNLHLLQPRVEDWQARFSRVFHLKHHTPYMHLMYDHTAKLIEQEGDIDVFNIQGLEKLNDNTSTEYFRKTNKKRDFLKQMIRCRSRVEYLRITSQTKRETEKKKQRKIQREDFFMNKDLFLISDLKAIGECGLMSDENYDEENDEMFENEDDEGTFNATNNNANTNANAADISSSEDELDSTTSDDEQTTTSPSSVTPAAIASISVGPTTAPSNAANASISAEPNTDTFNLDQTNATATTSKKRPLQTFVRKLFKKKK